MNITETDLYQLTMLQAYWQEGMDGKAVFDLFIRRSHNRDFFVVAGVNEALKELENLEFTGEEIQYLGSLDKFSDQFLNWLGQWQFSCDVHGMRDGEIAYPNEPILQVEGSVLEAQLVETRLLNQIGFQTNIASKAADVAESAGDKSVADFGMRRMHGRDAALKGSRAAYIGGVGATSNVGAGHRYGIPVTGTMAHSYVEAHDSEIGAFREFAETYPSSVLLIDTYDTVEGAKKVVQLLDEGYDIGGVRLDSGDLRHLSKAVRRYFDNCGYEDVEIYVSGGLDENKIAYLESQGAPIDGYGVGTRMMVVEDQPAADAVYKLCQYEGKGRMKLSEGKSNLPGRKEIWRDSSKDVIAAFEEVKPAGTDGVMKNLMSNGSLSPSLRRETLKTARERAQNRENSRTRRVQISDYLRDKEQETAKRVAE